MLNVMYGDEVYLGTVPDIRVKGWEMKVWYRESDHSVLYKCGEGFLVYITHGMMCNPKCAPSMRKLVRKHLGINDEQFYELSGKRVHQEFEDL